MTNKKILLLSENFPPIDGGSGRWFWELYSRVRQCRVKVLAHNVEGADAFDKGHAIDIERTPMSSTEWGIKSFTGLAFYWRLFFKVKNIVKNENIDEIHCGRVLPEGVVAWLVSKFTGVPYVCFVHGEDVETAATSREQSWLVKKVCQSTKYLLCNSKNSAKLVNDLGFGSIDKCRVLHPGVDLAMFKPATKDEEFLDNMGWTGKHVLLTVGRLQKRKGQDYFIQAMPELIERFPNIHYAIVGRGECEDYLRALVVEYNLVDNVSIHNDLDDEALVKAYQQCDAFILPNRTIGSDIEGFGMVLVEAQVCGKPVIAGDSGGTRETMNIGKTGHIIDCSSTENLLNGLSPILRNREIVDGEVDIADYAKNRFNWDQHVAKAKRLFK